MAALGRLVARARKAGQLNMLKGWEGASNVTHPASWRHRFSEYDCRAGYATKPGGLLGFLGKDGIFPSRQPSQPAAGHDYGVATLERDDDSEDEPARRLPAKHHQLVSVEPDDVKPELGQQVHKTTEAALGSILTKTGLEVELDVSLQELTIDKLVLKDLGLVLVIKTKPQPPPGSPPPPEEPDTRERKTRRSAQPQPEPQPPQ